MSLEISIITSVEWKEVSGVMCDRKMPVELKYKVFKTITRPANGIRFWMLDRKKERWEQTKFSRGCWDGQEGRPGWSTSEMKTSGRRRTWKLLKLCWKIKRLKWCGHWLRREHKHIWAKSLRLEVCGRWNRGRPKKKWRHNIQGDMKKYQLTEDMAQDQKILDDSNNDRPCTRRWSRKVRKKQASSVTHRPIMSSLPAASWSHTEISTWLVWSSYMWRLNCSSHTGFRVLGLYCNHDNSNLESIIYPTLTIIDSAGRDLSLGQTSKTALFL